MAAAAGLLFAFAAAAQDDIRAYDIPAQPLEQAVERFSVVSGWSVMYPGDLGTGRSSHPLQASLPPLQALQAVLQDTGVEAELIGAQRVVLRRAARAAAEASATGVASDVGLRRRFGDLQQRLRTAFCGDPDLAPGAYAATLRFRIANDGQVQEPELLAGSGSTRRDARLLQAMQSLRVDADAAALPQPVTLQIRPSSAGHDCGRRPPLP
nr:STN domain-containing protein [Stenotrophomonas indicatrix]